MSTPWDCPLCNKLYETKDEAKECFRGHIGPIPTAPLTTAEETPKVPCGVQPCPMCNNVLFHQDECPFGELEAANYALAAEVVELGLIASKLSVALRDVDRFCQRSGNPLTGSWRKQTDEAIALVDSYAIRKSANETTTQQPERKQP